MKRLATATLAALLTILVGSAAAAVINVPGDYAQIHDAVQAAEAGDTVVVAAGTYTDCTHETEGPGTTPACVIMKPGVTLQGAGSDLTIIDAGGLGRGIYVDDTDDVRIENLQVRGAYAEIYGAGILIREGSTGAEVVDCVIRDTGDGGIVVIQNAEATITNVQFLDNVAKQGGGLAVEETSTAVISNCLFDNNTAPTGAGMFVRASCTVTITGTTFTNNDIDAANGNGGGVCVQDSQCDISGCDFIGNTTQGSGGGLAYLSGATGTVEDCLISGNSTIEAYNYGGGISCQSSAPTFRNLVIVNNTATSAESNGGGIDVQFTPSPLIENCTIVGNACSAEEDAAGGIFVQWFATPTISNCIIASSTAGAGIICDDFSPDAVFTGCDIWNNAGGDAIPGIDGGCNFSADPLFCNVADNNYRIAANSPCSAGNHPDGGDCGTTHVGVYDDGCGTAVDGLPGASLVLGNMPNPFNPMTTMFFVLDAPGDVVIRIHDVRGHMLRTFSRNGLAADTRHEITWNGRDEAGRELPSGVYLYQLESNGSTISKRMSLIR